MKITKAITKWLLGAAVAGAFLLAAPNKAQAQVAFGVAVNAYPTAVAYAPAGYYGYGWRRHRYLEHERWEAARWRHDRFERDHYRYGYGYGYGYRRY